MPSESMSPETRRLLQHLEDHLDRLNRRVMQLEDAPLSDRLRALEAARRGEAPEGQDTPILVSPLIRMPEGLPDYEATLLWATVQVAGPLAGALSDRFELSPPKVIAARAREIALEILAQHEAEKPAVRT